MKYKGKAVPKPKPVIIAIPRGGEGLDVIFVANAGLNYDVFEAVLPEPKPGLYQEPGKPPVPDFEAEDYKARVADYNQKRWNWVQVTSLKDTPDLEWETIDYAKPDTWGNLTKELTDSGFSRAEINDIISGVLEANSVDEKKSKEALDRFLLSQPQLA